MDAIFDKILDNINMHQKKNENYEDYYIRCKDKYDKDDELLINFITGLSFPYRGKIINSYINKKITDVESIFTILDTVQEEYSNSQKYYKKKICFYCNKPNHIESNCYLKRKNMYNV